MWQGDTFQFRIQGVGKVYVTGCTDDCSCYRVKSKSIFTKMLPQQSMLSAGHSALEESCVKFTLIMENSLSPRSQTLHRALALSIILAIAIVAAVATTVYVIVVPKEGEKFTEFFILGEKKMAADYPPQLYTGQNSPLYIGIGNHEYRDITYTVETYFVQMTFNETDNTSTVNVMTPISRFTVPVAHNQTVISPHSFAPTTTGYNRIEFLLFNSTVPAEQVQGMDRISQSYRDLHLWVTIKSR